jgi:hypothetical protein
MEKKITKKDRFVQLLAINEVAVNEDLVNFIKHEIELLNKKSAKSGSSKTQKENAEIKELLLIELATIGKAVTITEFMKASDYAGEFSNQKISALFKQLVEAGKVEKTTDKGKSYFSAVGTEADTNAEVNADVDTEME